MEPDRDAPPRKGPGGRTVAARPGAARGAGTISSRPPEQVAVAVAPPEPTATPTVAPTAAPVAKAPKRPKAVRRPARVTPQPVIASTAALSVRNLTKRFGNVTAVDSVDLEIQAGTFYGFVGPNGAGKTTTLAMITGLLRPDSGVVRIHGADVWRNPGVAKRSLGVLPDNLRLFDRLTGAEFLHHAGALRRLDKETITHRVDDLAAGFGLRHSLDRFISDYSAGMMKKIAIAAAMIHSPRLLVLDEPFESVDPVSAASVIAILKKYAEAGGTVLLSSHSMGLIERTCDAVAIIANGRMLAAGPLADVLDGESLETRFVELAGGAGAVEGMEWLQSYSD
ncbi:ABC transporter ATP-binding protein [Pseudolysinimonas yzui]|uniref:ABC transporter ATP-binding protein n=1 Tax=Pseudolysinimonas yzui TaxID=2708254 RepID=A0A8J3GMI6_9MICO|nr:ABC transporter ATP-binding protein [Pseudolysinimonas yzui]GHF03966.1 ABC transporter ATP-binding protein [Pseudolysinimonas yzui]